MGDLPRRKTFLGTMKNRVRIGHVAGISSQSARVIMATSENPELCVTLPRQNAHLPNVNSAFVSVASLDFGVFGGCLIGDTYNFHRRMGIK